MQPSPSARASFRLRIVGPDAPRIVRRPHERADGAYQTSDRTRSGWVAAKTRPRCLRLVAGEDRSLRSDGVQHGPQIGHPCLESGDGTLRLDSPVPRRSCRISPRTGEAAEDRSGDIVLPHQVDVAQPSIANEVDRGVAHRVVGEVDAVARAHIACLGPAPRTASSPRRHPRRRLARAQPGRSIDSAPCRASTA